MPCAIRCGALCAILVICVLAGGCGDPPSSPSPVAPAPVPARNLSAPPEPAAPPATAALPASAPPAAVRATVGGGSPGAPAEGPAPAHAVDGAGFVLVKNWDFGTGPGSTITRTEELTEHFLYHDQFGTIANGTNYGALMVAPNEQSALKGRNQPIEGRDTGGRPVRAFTADALRTFLVPLRGATTCHPSRHDVGCGSFMAKWRLPKGGSRLGQDILWETRVRYVTPPYFWFAIWACGNKWSKGAEIDVVESFGYDNGGGHTNYDGRFWHSGIVGGREDEPYKNWQQSMKKMGVASFDATSYHVWTMLYKADDSIALYVDGIRVQTGFSHWTLGTAASGEAIDMSFLFDGGWGHTGVQSVNKPLPASAFEGAYYDWEYSRVYLRPAAPATPAVTPGSPPR